MWASITDFSFTHKRSGSVHLEIRFVRWLKTDNIWIGGIESKVHVEDLPFISFSAPFCPCNQILGWSMGMVTLLMELVAPSPILLPPNMGETSTSTKMSHGLSALREEQISFRFDLDHILLAFLLNCCLSCRPLCTRLAIPSVSPIPMSMTLSCFPSSRPSMQAAQWPFTGKM